MSFPFSGNFTSLATSNLQWTQRSSKSIKNFGIISTSRWTTGGTRTSGLTLSAAWWGWGTIPRPGPSWTRLSRDLAKKINTWHPKKTRWIPKDMLKSFQLIGIFKPRRVAVPLLLSLFLIVKLLVAGKAVGMKHQSNIFTMTIFKGSW